MGAEFENFGKAPAQKTFLGRTWQSWCKILGFYVVYYTLLAILATTFIGKYESYMPQPISGHNCTIADNTETCITPPMIMTRLDQPGGASTPFNRIFSDLKTFLKEENKDGTGAFLKDLNSDELDQIEPLRLEVPVIKLNPDSNDPASQLYIQSMMAFADEQRNAVKNCKNWSNGKNCDDKNLEYLTEENLIGWVKNLSPVVLLHLNQVINWEPINTSKLNSNLLSQNTDQFQNENGVFANCYRTNVCGAVHQYSDKFNLTIVGGSEGFLPSEKFPFKGYNFAKEKRSYVKPYVMLQINNNGGWTDEEKDNLKGDQRALRYFSCYFQADNLENPPMPEAVENEPEKCKATSGNSKTINLSKLDTVLGQGIIKFAIQYDGVGLVKEDASGIQERSTAEQSVFSPSIEENVEEEVIPNPCVNGRSMEVCPDSEGSGEEI